ncbi:unnamed protein product [Tilletia controversa]|uniref:Nudix hydrolase domain-containing protein n=2 Tax=Tilletia TaxID=13289 RepID=A0A177UK62_9BASI|nr:hypothetical protein CF336_g5503 [Tilletia laevis]KAE8257023.1 hypothetical protein A4X03_0g4823 [Tilletia caries]CAD6925073.1 unnamed protein product [Tilletia controversa]CAD6884399.1 unnamed protein product [Tilletia caries]CAD6904087.1 unnamed protein product [Tilletia caries]
MGGTSVHRGQVGGEGGGKNLLSLLEVVHLCHNCHEPQLDPNLHSFLVDGVRFGYIIPSVYAQIQKEVTSSSSPSERAIRLIAPSSATASSTGTQSVLGAVTFSDWCQTPDQRSTALQSLAEKWKKEGLFPYQLGGWRNELYAIWGPGHTVAFRLERAACALWGVATFGVHLNGYTPDMRVWIPRRAANKATWPSYLDNTVAGGITAGDSQGESIVRECWEEAGFPEDLVRKHIKATGVITYVHKTDDGFVQPEIEYTYDLALPSADILPQPVDGEAEAFELMSFEQIITLLRQARFKPNCALVLIDFYIRHGLITAESEPDYVEIVAKLHKSLGLPMP